MAQNCIAALGPWGGRKKAKQTRAEAKIVKDEHRNPDYSLTSEWDIRTLSLRLGCSRTEVGAVWIYFSIRKATA